MFSSKTCIQLFKPSTRASKEGRVLWAVSPKQRLSTRTPRGQGLRGSTPKGSPQEPPEGRVQGAGPLVHPYDPVYFWLITLLPSIYKFQNFHFKNTYSRYNLIIHVPKALQAQSFSLFKRQHPQKYWFQHQVSPSYIIIQSFLHATCRNKNLICWTHIVDYIILSMLMALDMYIKNEYLASLGTKTYKGTSLLPGADWERWWQMKDMGHTMTNPVILQS